MFCSLWTFLFNVEETLSTAREDFYVDASPNHRMRMKADKDGGPEPVSQWFEAAPSPEIRQFSALKAQWVMVPKPHELHVLQCNKIASVHT